MTLTSITASAVPGTTFSGRGCLIAMSKVIGSTRGHIHARLGEDDAVQREIEAAVAAAVDSVALPTSGPV